MCGGRAPSPRPSVAVDVLEELRETNATVLALVAELKRGSGSTQTVIHKSSAGGFVAGFAVAACIACLAITYESSRSLRNEMDKNARELRDDMRDQKAWTEVLRGKVATLEGKQK